MLETTAVLAAAAVAAYTDARTRRIPNWIAGCLFAFGLALHAAFGWQSMLSSLALALAVFAIGTALFSLRFAGGGDVKLIAAACAVLGWPDSAIFLAATLIAGGALGVVFAVSRGRLRPAMANIGAMLTPMLSGSKPFALPSVAGAMPYGIAIFAGAAVVLLAHACNFTMRIHV